MYHMQFFSKVGSCLFSSLFMLYPRSKQSRVVFLFWWVVITMVYEHYAHAIENSKQTVGFLFAHGLGGNKNNKYWYQPGNPLNWAILDAHASSFDFPEVHNKDPKVVNLAQEGDIQALAQAHRELSHRKDHPDSLVLMGLSRGASTIITYAGSQLHANASLLPVKALILESPFDSVEEVIDYWLKPRYSHNSSPSQSVITPCYYSMFPGYNKHGIKPIQAIASIDRNMPLLLTCSKNDGLTPDKSSLALYAEAKKTGHPHCYILVLEDGKHAHYQQGKSSRKYLTTVHAFYERYDLPHDKQLAHEGRPHLALCQP